MADRVERDWTPYATFTLGFLTLVSTFNYFDRALLGLALPLIKAEMHASDTVLGLVSGAAFAVCYSLVGIPVAWLADRYSRKTIIGIGFGFWSLMTLLTGFVGNIWQLAVARFLLAAGEATGIAPSNSMVSDLFRRARRPLALAIFGTANSISSLLYFPIAGWIGDAWGWRAMFMAAGLPGLVLAALFLLAVKEPTRGGAEAVEVKPRPEPLAATLRFLWGSKAYVLLFLGVTFMGANVWAASAWTPSFLARVHGLSTAEIGATIGPLRGALGFVGILLGGLLIDRLGRADERWRLRLPAIACLIVGPAEVVFLLADAKPVWIAGFAATAFFTLAHQPPVYAAAMNLARPSMRAVAVAVIILASSLVGQVAGPLIVGALNDLMAPSLGVEAIRYSLLLVSVTAVLAGACIWAAAHFIERDLERVKTARAVEP